MSPQEYELVRNAFESKATGLLHHEGKEYACVGLPSNNYTEKKVAGRRFITVSTVWFKEIIDKDLALATEKFRQNFGVNSTKLVLEAVYKTQNVNFPDFDFFVRNLNHEQFCLVFDLEQMSEDKILRIDLFRQDRDTEFGGGLFHAFGHFNFKGIPLSTGVGETQIAHPMFMIDYAIDAFFHYQFQPGKRPNTFTSSTKFNNKQLQFVFYLEKNSGVYFIDTAHVMD